METTPTRQSMSAPAILCKSAQTLSLLPASKTAIRDISTWDPLAAPYCRNTVPLLLEQAQTSGISRILSCTLQNYNYRYEYTDAGLIETQHGTPAYDTLLQLLDAYTAPKRIAAPDGQTVDTGVRTIYMPAVLHCTNGIPDRCWQYSSTGITLDAGQSAYDPWTPAQQLLAKESLQEFFAEQ